MKIQNKIALSMNFIGIVIIIFTAIFYNNLSQKTILNEKLMNLKDLSAEISQKLNNTLEANKVVALTISSAPVIKEALIKSNIDFSTLSESDRNRKIEQLNNKWMNTEDINNTFIQKYLTNNPAKFLKLQQKILPGQYGEIFLTNKYGVMIASTGKLTTLAHKQKYWWQASFNNGKGKTFIDDRGFDDSVNGYVIGIVVPIMDKNEFIGILKCNINIVGELTDTIQSFTLNNSIKIEISRTKGLILAEEGYRPLSNRLPDNLLQYIQIEKAKSFMVGINKNKKLAAFAPVEITQNSDLIGFGGSEISIDHKNGNKGEGWNIVIVQDKSDALREVSNNRNNLIIFEIIFILLASIFSLLFGKWITKPLISLSNIAYKFGEGDLSARIKVSTKDEIGKLATAFNTMAEKLNNTLISRDKLIHENKLRKKAEKEVKLQLEEKSTILKETHHRIKNNFATISGLLNTQAMSLENPEAVTALNNAAGRVNSMAILYEKMLHADSYLNSSVKEYLNSLIKDIASLFPQSSNITIEKQIQELSLSPKELFPIGIMLNELLTNIFKYAYIGKESGIVKINLKLENNYITLTIQDNGIGLANDFDIKKQKGFGIALIRMLTEQLRGEFSMENFNGTKTILKFPV